MNAINPINQSPPPRGALCLDWYLDSNHDSPNFDTINKAFDDVKEIYQHPQVDRIANEWFNGGISEKAALAWLKEFCKIERIERENKEVAEVKAQAKRK